MSNGKKALSEKRRNSMALRDSDLRSELTSILAHARRDAMVFAVTTVILTPVFVAVAIVVLFFALAFVDLPLIDDLGYGLSFVTGVNLALAFMVGSYFLQPKAPNQCNESDRVWVAVGLGFLCVLLGLSYTTPFATTHPLQFWSAYLLLALAMLACMGHAYEPREDYYLGWTAGPFLMGDPFTVEDDIDRAHFSLGFAVGMSHMIMESYSGIFGSTWLWRGLEERELSGAVGLLQALAANDSSRARACVQILGRASALRVVRALVKLKMVTIVGGHLRLRLKVREHLGLGA